MTAPAPQESPTGSGPLAVALFGGVILGVPVLVLLILRQLEAPLWIILAVCVVWVSWVCVAVWVERPSLRDRQIDARQAAPRRYRDHIGRLLTGLARFILPDTVENNPRPKGISAHLRWLHQPLARNADDLQRLARNPLSWPVHDLALRIAIAYPIVFALGQLVATDSAVLFAGYVMVPSDIPYWWGATTFFAIAIATLFRLFVWVRPKSAFAIFSTWLFWIGITFAVALAFVAAGTPAGASPGALGFALVGAGLLAGAIAVSGSVAFAIAFAVVGTDLLEGTFAAASAFALLGAFAVTFAVAGAVFWATRNGRGQAAYLVLHLAALAAALLAAILIPADDPNAIWIIAIAVLPLVNAWFDWLSYGLTLWLLGIGHRKDRVWRLACGLIDIGAAALLFFALSFSLVGTLVLIEAWRAEPLLGPLALLESIRAGDLSDNAWVIAMVASTLVPTLVHLAIGFFSLMTLIRGSVWTWLSTHMTLADGIGHALLATLAYSVLRLGFLVVPSMLLLGTLWMIWTYGGKLAVHYADLLIRVSEGLGWM